MVKWLTLLPHCLSATLTSYSAESAAERDDSAKYPNDGYHGSNQNLWPQVGRPVVAPTSSSYVIAEGTVNDGFLYRVEDNMAASTYSLNKLHPDRATGSVYSLGSTHSIPLYLMPRPNSVAGKMASCVCVSVCVGVWIKWFPVLQCTRTHSFLLGRKYMTLSN